MSSSSPMKTVAGSGCGRDSARVWATDVLPLGLAALQIRRYRAIVHDLARPAARDQVPSWTGAGAIISALVLLRRVGSFRAGMIASKTSTTVYQNTARKSFERVVASAAR